MMMRAAVVAVGAAGVVILAAVSSSGRRAIPPLVFLLVYSLALLFAAARIAADPIDDRLLAPLFAPAVVVLLVSAQRVVGWCRRYRFGRPAPIVAATLAAVWLITSGGGSVRIVRNHLMGRSGGYEAADWQRSETIARLRHGDVPAGLYANDPFAIRYLTGHEARLSPRRHAYQSPGSHVNDVPALLEMLAAAPNLYLVWFDASRRDFLLTPDELSAWFTLEPVLSLNDGTVYRITERLRQ